MGNYHCQYLIRLEIMTCSNVLMLLHDSDITAGILHLSSSCFTFSSPQLLRAQLDLTLQSFSTNPRVLN